MTVIDRFTDEYRFLSNFYPSPIELMGVIYPTAEHAYQSMKTLDRTYRLFIAELKTPGMARRAGRQVILRPGWDDIKLEIMQDIVELKFLTHSDLLERLVVTYPATLIEGNTWGDTFWGQVNGVGENHLGQILMRVRRDFAPLLKSEQDQLPGSESS